MGLTEADYAEVDATAREQEHSMLAIGNFTLTVVLMKKFAEMAARLIPPWEILDYARVPESRKMVLFAAGVDIAGAAHSQMLKETSTPPDNTDANSPD